MSGEDHGAGEVSGEFERGQSVPRSSVIPGYLSCEQGLKNVLFIVLAGHLSYVVPFFNFLLSQTKPLCTPPFSETRPQLRDTSLDSQGPRLPAHPRASLGLQPKPGGRCLEEGWAMRRVPGSSTQ